MAGKNVLKTQLQTGGVEKPAIISLAKDTRAMDISLTSGEDNLSGVNKIDLHERKCIVEKFKKVKCHQGTQTKTFTLPIASILGHESLEGNHNQYM